MNATHIHLMLNHVAILAAIFSILIFIYGFIRKNETVKNIALSGYVLAALAAIPVFLTGEPAEESVENIPGVLESVIEQHEEAAELAIWLIEITGIAALGALLMRKMKFFSGTGFATLMLFVSLASAGTISYTGYLGGKIRHTELNAGTTTGADQNVPEAGGEDGDDD